MEWHPVRSRGANRYESGTHAAVQVFNPSAGWQWQAWRKGQGARADVRLVGWFATLEQAEHACEADAEHFAAAR